MGKRWALVVLVVAVCGLGVAVWYGGGMLVHKLMQMHGVH